MTSAFMALGIAVVSIVPIVLIAALLNRRDTRPTKGDHDDPMNSGSH